MLGRWCIQDFPEMVWIARRSRHGGLPEGAEPISAESAAWRVESWFGGDGMGRQLLHQIHEEALGPGVQTPLHDIDRLRAGVRAALQSGVLQAYRLREKLSGAPIEREEVPVQKAAPAAEKKTWVAIELVDDEGQPVPYAKYRVELPDHSVREGSLDGGGKARIEGIVDGECKVSFPYYHADDWKAA